MMRKWWQISCPFYPLVDSRSILGSLSFLPICTIWRAHISTFAPMMMVMIYRFPNKTTMMMMVGTMMMMVGTMSGGGWLRLSPVGKHLELTHWGGIIRICPAPYIIMDCRSTQKEVLRKVLPFLTELPVRTQNRYHFVFHVSLLSFVSLL